MTRSKFLDELAVVTAQDFSTTGVKTLAFSRKGEIIARIAHENQVVEKADGSRELEVAVVEQQATESIRQMSALLQQQERRWLSHGISATHHSAARVDSNGRQIRRVILWNDGTLPRFHQIALRNLGGQPAAKRLTGTCYAARYTLSHLVKDEQVLSEDDWRRTHRILPHGPLAAAVLTGNLDEISVSPAGSTGLLDLRTRTWSRDMLKAISNPQLRDLAWEQLPRILHWAQPLGRIKPELVGGIPAPLVFGTIDDQAAALIGGGAARPQHAAIVCGSSIVVNACASQLLAADELDVMPLPKGDYLVMRCMSNGALVLNEVLGVDSTWTADTWSTLEQAARQIPPGANRVYPFRFAEPSLGIDDRRKGICWVGPDGRSANEPASLPERCRALYEAFAYFIKIGVQAHEAAGETIASLTVSGGMARSDLFCEIIGSTLNRPLRRIASDEVSALGAAVVALAEFEQHHRSLSGDPEPFTLSDAVECLVSYRDDVLPISNLVAEYERLFQVFVVGLKRF